MQSKKTMYKNIYMNFHFIKPAIYLALTSTALAGDFALQGPLYKTASKTANASNAFDGFRRPVTNPTLFDLALPTTKLHLIYLNQQLPDQINLATGGQADFGGDLQIYALQFEYAFNERLSLVALKDGFADFNPDDNFTAEQGIANISAGLKYAYIYDPARQFVASTTIAFEIPLGDDEVFQGEGDGNIILTTQALKLHGAWQFAGALGLQIPVESDFSTLGFFSSHVSYEVNRWFIPFVEANVFTILNEGRGNNNFDRQLNGNVPSLAPSEGADLLNFGSSNSEEYVTLGFGFQSRITDHSTLGIAYEIPLTDEENNITDSRLTIDISYNF